MVRSFVGVALALGLLSACDKPVCPPVRMTVNNRSTKALANVEVCLADRCSPGAPLAPAEFMITSMRAPSGGKPQVRWDANGQRQQHEADVDVAHTATGTLELAIQEDGTVKVERNQLSKAEPIACYWTE